MHTTNSNRYLMPIWVLTRTSIAIGRDYYFFSGLCYSLCFQANTNTLESNSINLFIVSLFSSCLLAAMTTFKPYKEKKNNTIESFYLLNLVLLTFSSLYVLATGQLDSQVFAYSILVGVAFLSFMLVIGYHVYLIVPTRKCFKSNFPTHSPAIQLVEEEQEEEFEDIPTNNNNTNLCYISREPLLEMINLH